jgi:proline dehydrogenase
MGILRAVALKGLATRGILDHMSFHHVDFSNTRIAYAHKSLADLRRSLRIFHLLSKPWLSKLGSRLVGQMLKWHVPITPAVKPTLFKQFCGGTSIQNCKSVVDHLAKFGVGTVLDYGSEGRRSEATRDHTLREVLKSVEVAARTPHIKFAVIKVTGLSRIGLLETLSLNASLSPREDQEWRRALKRVETVCDRCEYSRVPLFVDAEESWVQPAIDRLVLDQMKQRNKKKALVYTTLQMYKTTALKQLESLMAQAKKEGFVLGLKLVRGAYLEKERERSLALRLPSPVFETKAETDAAFDQALALCIQNLDHVALCAGTHNEKSCARLMELMDRQKISESDPRVEFTQLYGMADHVTFNLAHAGYQTSKYVPYGPVRTIMPYLIRRAEENASITGNVRHEITLLKAELQRRNRSGI